MEPHAKHLPADERRAVTVETVVALAAEQDPSEITTTAIAKRMHLTQGALFRHFPTKESLWQAVMEWVAERLLARIERAAAEASTPLAALEAMFLSHVEFVADHPGVPRMLFGELQRSGESPAKQMARTLIARYGERLKQIIEQGKACGEIAVDIDTSAAATLFLGTLQGLVVQSLLAGEVTRLRSEAPGALTLYLRAIRSAS